MSWKNCKEINDCDEDNEVDYMSEDFIVQCGQDDVRPGLVVTHATKRKHELEKKRKNKLEEQKKTHRPIKAIQAEFLKEGLDTAISSTNKGFAMLQKMGYTPGSSLGKHGSGRLEPVKVELKIDRQGLGWQRMIVEKKKRREEIQLKRLEKKKSFDAEEYRNRKKNELLGKKVLSDLRKCQRECYQLDDSKGVETPPESWFWPPYSTKTDEDYKDDEDENEEGDDDEHDEKRTKWSSEVDENDEEYEEDYYEEDEEIYEPQDQLEIITAYLRDTYNYCIWCGTIYEDSKDLLGTCPGSSKMDHDD